LSHQQIDHWLGKIAAILQEKLNHLKMLRNFIAITDLLRQNEIPFISLKGPLLSQHIYNDPTVRFSHDIDILIDEQQIDSTVKLFLDNGCFLKVSSGQKPNCNKSCSSGIPLTSVSHNREINFV
jgi:hypothetical protein